jgi:CubicO group peptidase (beta-lactamase class C family)
MKNRAALLMLTAVLFAPRFVATQKTGAYFPDRFDWQHRKPEEVGMTAAAVDEAVKIAIDSESTTPRDLGLMLAESFGRNEPFDTPIGPVKPRAAANGLITRHGYIVAEWGEPASVDMTFSVTKTFLTTVIGLAWQRGLIRDVNDYARAYMPPGVDLFEAPHNRNIKWDDLLRQTSDWQGTLWGKPDWADRPEGKTPADWPNRELHEPGTHYKYNDVRVNVMALAALHVWRRPLPDVLRQEVMEPIGASSTWRWHGYENSRRPLGRRHVHQRIRHGPLRVPVPAQGQMEGARNRLGEMDPDGADARTGQRQLRLRELVPQHRQEAADERPGDDRVLRRERRQRHLC